MATKLHYNSVYSYSHDNAGLCLMAWQMAIAAVAHMFVFSTAPYHYISAYEYGKVTTETTKTKLKLEESDTQAVFERKETQVKAPGTSVTESVQDIVVDGGQRVSSFPINKDRIECIFRRSFDLYSLFTF